MKLGVCVPYRNREAHLKEFVPKVGKYLESKGIDYCMYFGHQVDDKLFNRGAMKNVAAEWAFKEGCDYIVWHDIDMIPEEGCDYSFPEKYPIHIATNISQMDYQLKLVVDKDLHKVKNLVMIQEISLVQLIILLMYEK